MIRTRNRALALTAALALTSLSVPAFAQEAESPAPEPSGSPATETPTNVSAETGAALAELVPAEIAGIPLETSIFEAAGILANVESDALLLDMADVALEYDSELNQFAIAGGAGIDGESFVSVIGGRLPGVPAEALQESFIGIVLGPVDPELVTTETVAGSEATVIRAAAGSGPADTAYLLPMGEVVWLVIADEASLGAAIEALTAE